MFHRTWTTVVVLAGSLLPASAAEPWPGVVKSEFIFDKAPSPECHASTIVETKPGLVTAWFGGTREKNPDVGIWVSRHIDGKWTPPIEVINGVEEDKRYPCWNPVLFQPKDGPLLLFAKVGPSPSTWWGVYSASEDSGKTWTKAVRLKDKIIGPVKNKPIQLADGTILCGTSDEHTGWQVRMERMSKPDGAWETTKPLNDGRKVAAIQPTILTHKDQLQILCRSRNGGKILESWSKDNGKTWSDFAATDLPNPNSGIDAVTLKDGRHLLIYNHTRFTRSPLNLAISKDGKTWQAALVLESEPGEYSYPAIIQTNDGLVHMTYTWKRKKVKHVVADPAKLMPRDMVGGEWPRN